MFCTNCGKQIPDSSTFCPLCGAKILSAGDNPPANAPVEPVFNEAGAQPAFNSAPVGQPEVKSPEPAHRKKPNKKLIIILSCVAALVVILAIAIPLIVSGIQANRYEQAQAALEEGDYLTANELFVSLGTYEDSEYFAEYSADMLAYESASALMDGGEYEAAEAAFLELGDFKDSADLADECHARNAYELGEEAYNNQNYKEAFDYFTEAGTYSDASTMADICGNFVDYEAALEYMEAENYIEAQALLENVDTLVIPDAAEKLEECNNAVTYAEAGVLLAAGDNCGAYTLYSSLGDYLDSAALAEKCTVEKPATGETYHNEDYKSSAVTLTIKPPKTDGSCTYFKIYTTDDVLVCSVFINAGDTAKVKLPAGDYIFKSSYSFGPWFGETDMFGDLGYYQVLKYSDTSEVFPLKRNYIYTLTLRATEGTGNVDHRNTDRVSF